MPRTLLVTTGQFCSCGCCSFTQIIKATRTPHGINTVLNMCKRTPEEAVDGQRQASGLAWAYQSCSVDTAQDRNKCLSNGDSVLLSLKRKKRKDVALTVERTNCHSFIQPESFVDLSLWVTVHCVLVVGQFLEGLHTCTHTHTHVRTHTWRHTHTQVN